MKQKSILSVAALGMVAAFTATAFAAEKQPADAKAGQAEAIKTGKPETKRPVKRDSRTEEKATTPKVMQLRDWEELFGHKPMEGENHMPMPEPASGASQQETMQPMQEHGHMQEKR